ncbi:recombinase family protein [Rhizobium ruizarguesonis]|uniref:recombinase family protein n=1 Tax=Rhizobium ruizarguesonis TaxID=2081791 RepID=UPI00102F48E9|nr:recombinase family protein [Rhizobium ruizarguesonis]TBD19398.1 recombinase family protein [Rhizobium ruizarguesonis]TBD35026.1 recombinase family protein [Rhizobium ruizarguesonis]TBD56128.1 recombinase family protein [Rhizobium ruizarguesonis]TBF03456.1 recombinase family protein [Rhizobium ruizarguesonis]
MTTYRTSKQAVAYIRVSTDKQGERGIGLEAQRAAIRTYADAVGVEIIEWFQDVASGRGEKNLALRDGLNRALEFARANDVDLLVDGLDRLSRHTDTIEHIIRNKKVMVVSVSEDRTKDPLVIASRAARAELEGDKIAERTRRALSEKKASGTLLGNRTNLPEAQKLGASSNKRRAEEKVDEIARAIQANQWHDLSVPTLAGALNGIGVKTSRGEAWTAAALRRPHRAALEFLRTSTLADYQSHPNFGRF